METTKTPWVPSNTPLWYEYTGKVKALIEDYSKKESPAFAKTVLYATNVVAVLDCFVCQDAAVKGIFEIYSDLTKDPTAYDRLAAAYHTVNNLRAEYHQRWESESTRS